MRKRVPLNAIRAFEATARHSSVVRAAEELCVTPTAVSHQIRQLEEFIQMRLFIRKNARIELTAEARANVTLIAQALDLINNAVNSLEALASNNRKRLTISASTSVASFWLMPMLPEFTRRHPEIDLSIRTFLNGHEAEEQDSDILIVNWDCQMDRHFEPLLEEEVIPVCAPALAAHFGNDPHKILSKAALIHVDRVHDGSDGTYPDWPRYLAESGIMRRDILHGARFNQAGTSIEAAATGVGVVLGRSLLIREALETGRLVTVGQSFRIRSPYYLCMPWSSVDAEPVRLFRDWLHDRVHAQKGAVAT